MRARVQARRSTWLRFCAEGRREGQCTLADAEGLKAEGLAETLETPKAQAGVTTGWLVLVLEGPGGGE